MIVYVAWPTNNIARSNATARAWLSLGYRIAVATELKVPDHEVLANELCHIKTYEGYYRTMNFLCQSLVRDMKADIVICAGDGIYPAPGRPCWGLAATVAAKYPNGFGVMQPVGFQWQPNRGPGQYNFHDVPTTHLRCESPWICRNFILEAYGGQGPYHQKYRQYFGDVELYDIASRMGVLWRRDDVAQKSVHWSQADGPDGTESQKNNYTWHFENDWGTYRARRFQGYKGHERAQSRIIVPSSRIMLP